MSNEQVLLRSKIQVTARWKSAIKFWINLQKKLPSIFDTQIKKIVPKIISSVLTP